MKGISNDPLVLDRLRRDGDAPAPGPYVPVPDPKPCVGMPATLLRGMCRYPLTIVAVNSSHDCVVRECDYRRTDTNGKSYLQTWKIRENPSGREFRITKRPQVNRWTVRGDQGYGVFVLGARDAFIHPSLLKW